MNLNTTHHCSRRAVCAGIALLSAFALQGVAAAKTSDIRLKARLAGNAAGPTGEAEFHSNPAKLRSSLEIEVEHVAIPDNTVLTVVLHQGTTDTTIGTMTLKGGEGELELSTEEGDKVPAVAKGDTLMIQFPAGTTILSGTF